MSERERERERHGAYGEIGRKNKCNGCCGDKGAYKSREYAPAVALVLCALGVSSATTAKKSSEEHAPPLPARALRTSGTEKRDTGSAAVGSAVRAGAVVCACELTDCVWVRSLGRQKLVIFRCGGAVRFFFRRTLNICSFNGVQAESVSHPERSRHRK